MERLRTTHTSMGGRSRSIVYCRLRLAAQALIASDAASTPVGTASAIHSRVSTPPMNGGSGTSPVDGRAHRCQLPLVGSAHQVIPRRVPAKLLGDQIAHGHRLGNRIEFVDPRQGRVGEDVPGTSAPEYGQLSGCRTHPAGICHQQRSATRTRGAYQHRHTAGRDVEVHRSVDRTPRPAHRDTARDHRGLSGLLWFRRESSLVTIGPPYASHYRCLTRTVTSCAIATPFSPSSRVSGTPSRASGPNTAPMAWRCPPVAR